MLKAFTFLGLRQYENTIYIKHDGSDTYETDLFPNAVANLYKPDQIIAFTTPKDIKQEDLKTLAKGTNFLLFKMDSTDELWDLLSEKTKACSYSNFLGYSRWKLKMNLGYLCQCVDANVVKKNDEIILDITHAFRSIPLLIFIVAAYLRQVKSVKLKHIIYGAFEARNQDTNRTPIFDLTPFVELLDWMNAVNVFQNSGDARPIADLNVDPKIDNALTRLSNALLTNRTLEAQDAARVFNGLEFESEQALPFQMLIDQLKQSYQQMAVNNPSGNPKNSLKAQYQQIKWYIDNQHYLQAITLMREWLISWKCLNTQGDWLTKQSRDNAEDEFNQRLRQQDSPFAQLASDQTDITLWKQCVEIRNDLAHCGMRYKRDTSVEAIKAIHDLFIEFEKFANPTSQVG